MGIEPTLSAWKAEVLPLNYTRRVPTEVVAITEPAVPPATVDDYLANY